MVTSDADLKRLAKEFDVFVSGSDQIWNPKIISEDGQLDPHYFLDFVAGKTKFSYASSLGTYQYDESESGQVRDLLHDYSGITVREKDSAEYLSALLQRKVDDVLDPTLLFNKREWLAFFDLVQKQPEQPYILVYALKKDLLLKQTVEQVAAKLGYPVITIDQDPFTNFSNEQHIKDAGPVEFIELFANASFIVTNSFHGTCFSVNFNIPFIVTSPLSSINRIENLLSIVGASDRIKLHADNVQEIISEDIDFDYANTRLESLRIECKKYIKDTIVT